MIRITENTEKKGLEVAFTAKPDAATRDALKAAGFRWHNKRKIWFAKDTQARREVLQGIAEGAEIVPAAAIEGAEKFTLERLQKIRDCYTFEVTEAGTRYEGWCGCNEQRYNTDQELKKAILTEFKRHGIKATARSGRGGLLTAFTFTITVPAECVISEADYIEANKNKISGRSWYQDADGRDVHRDALFDLEEQERDRIIINTLSNEYKYSIANGRGLHVLPEFVETVKAIVNSFNHDNSDSTTDYFDRGIYDDYRWKAAA